MSWRTQGTYRGLDDGASEWLREFDRSWDTRDSGRSRTDAYEHLKGPERSPTVVCPRTFLLVPRLMDIPTIEEAEASLELRLLDVAGRVARFTVPHRLKAGWSIHLVLDCGRRVRVRFSDRSSAVQAYLTLQEYSLAMTMS